MIYGRSFTLLMASLFFVFVSQGYGQEEPDSLETSSKLFHFLKHVRILGEFYNESSSIQRLDDNFVSASNFRLGFRIHGIPKLTVELYGLARYGRDLNKDFWNNRAETGAGIRLRFFSKVFLAIYSEWIQGFYLKVPEGYPQASDDKYDDIRVGFLFWYGWGKSIMGKHLFSFPLRPMGEIYSDLSYFRSQKHNVIDYMHIKSGIHFFRIWKVAFDPYGVIYLMKDINKDFWNNKTEIGPGLWIRPIPGLELKLYVEWLSGFYFGIEGEDPNPFPQKYHDRKVGVTFWYGW